MFSLETPAETNLSAIAFALFSDKTKDRIFRQKLKQRPCQINKEAPCRLSKRKLTN